MVDREHFSVEDSPFGPMLVATGVPRGAGVFFSGSEFEGRLGDGVATDLRRWINGRFAVDAPLATCHQVHGTNLGEAAGDHGWSELESCDAVWSAGPARTLAIKVADCVAILILDSDGAVAAGIHAGWRGATAGIVPRTLRDLSNASAFDPARATAWIGPAIRGCCFEVGEEVVAAIKSQREDGDRFVDRARGEKPHVDLAGLVTAQLVDAGLARESIIDSGACTRCGEGFHSYRRGGRNAGRNLAVITFDAAVLKG